MLAALCALILHFIIDSMNCVRFVTYANFRNHKALMLKLARNYFVKLYNQKFKRHQEQNSDVGICMEKAISVMIG